MEYYKINLSFYNDNDKNNKIASEANGDKIPNAESFFQEISEGKVLDNAPIFDYFFLESYDKKNIGNGNYQMYMD